MDLNEGVVRIDHRKAPEPGDLAAPRGDDAVIFLAEKFPEKRDRGPTAHDDQRLQILRQLGKDRRDASLESAFAAGERKGLRTFFRDAQSMISLPPFGGASITNRPGRHEGPRAIRILAMMPPREWPMK
jgi:hypothetical protein